MPKQFKDIPPFKSEDDEFEFWRTHDTTDYFDWSGAERISFPNLKPTEDVDLKLKELLVMRDIERIAKQNHTSKRELIVRYLTDAIERNSQAARPAH